MSQSSGLMRWMSVMSDHAGHHPLNSASPYSMDASCWNSASEVSVQWMLNTLEGSLQMERPHTVPSWRPIKWPIKGTLLKCFTPLYYHLRKIINFFYLSQKMSSPTLSDQQLTKGGSFIFHFSGCELFHLVALPSLPFPISFLPIVRN